MEITFVAQKLDINGGGSNQSLDLMARLLLKRGHEISILTIKPTLNNLPQDYPYRVLTPPEPKFGTRHGVLDQVYRGLLDQDETADLYHVFTPQLLPAAGYYRKRSDSIPVIGRLNTYSAFCVNMSKMDGKCHKSCNIRSKFAHQDASLLKRIGKLPFYASRTYIEPKFNAALDRYFAISPAAKKIYAAVGIPQDRIEVIPNFCDSDFGLEDKPKAQNKEMMSSPSCFDNTSETTNLLYVGHLKHYKGVDLLLEAIREIPDCNGYVVGDGPAKDDLLSKVQNFELTDRVSFEGWVDHNELPSYYYEADIFAHPARLPEPFGRTILESLQCGTPTVVSDIGGPPWVAGDAGRTFPSEDAKRLAEILAELRDNPGRIEEMRKNCQPQVNRFRPENVVPKIENQYNKVLAAT